MKKRLRIVIALFLVLFVVAILAIPENRLTISGYIRGEHLFKGRPTSYWRYKVEQYIFWCEHRRPRAKSTWEKLFSFISSSDRDPKPDVLWGNPKAVPVLIDLTRERNNLRLFVEAYQTLSTLGRSARDAIPTLKEDVKDEDTYRSMRALIVLRQMGPDGVPIVIGALKDDRPQIRIQAAAELGRIGLDARVAVPDLIQALEDKEEGVSTWAAISLTAIDPESAKKAGAERFMPKPSEPSAVAASPP
jgi:hypothetical protein